MYPVHVSKSWGQVSMQCSKFVQLSEWVRLIMFMADSTQKCIAYSWFQSGLRVWVTTRVLTLLSASLASTYLQ